MSARSGRIDAYLVVGGWWHDFDYARFELLKHLHTDDRVRVKVASDFEDVDAIQASDILVAYTCNVTPSEAAQTEVRTWVERGGRFFALHGTNSVIVPPEELGKAPFTTPRSFPVWADTLGSQFISHPAMGTFPVTISPGAEGDPLLAGIEPFESGYDELYLCEYHGTIEPLLETRWHGDTGLGGFETNEWPLDEPRLVLYRRPLGEGCVLYFSLGHRRGHYDMWAPPHHGMYWPDIETGSWEIAEYHELLQRGLEWCKEPTIAAHAAAKAASAAAKANAARTAEGAE